MNRLHLRFELFLERLGVQWGEFLLQTVRGFEFATALGTLNNAVFTLQLRDDGSPVASFLRGATGPFALPPAWWALVFGVFGVWLLKLFKASMPAGGFLLHLGQRALAYALLTTLYAAVSVQVLSGTESPFLVGRYLATGFLSLCVAVLLVRLLWNRRARSRLMRKEKL